MLWQRRLRLRLLLCLPELFECWSSLLRRLRSEASTFSIFGASLYSSKSPTVVATTGVESHAACGNGTQCCEAATKPTVLTDRGEDLKDVFPGYRPQLDDHGLQSDEYLPFDPIAEHFPSSIYIETL